jgi:hypothetical protein
MIRLLLLLVVLGGGGYLAYHWWESHNGSGDGGYHGVAAERYRTAYTVCKRTVSGQPALSQHVMRVMSRAMRGRYRAAALAGCEAGAKSAGLSGILSQLQQATSP